MNNYQRIGSQNNATVGRIFENKIYEYFLSKEKIDLKRQPSIKIGVSNFEKEHKEHKFDLISREEKKEKIIIECKCHKWRKKINVPSAKMTIWNEAMYYFLLLPKKYKKYFVIPKDYNEKRKMTLAQYYISQYKHLIPKGVEIFEYDERNNNLEKVL
ncbi:hypothetical protein KKF38_00785 [Patescibacteria group bacterium]|nr:hypothetical protein [Patescibacteria group bacterium]